VTVPSAGAEPDNVRLNVGAAIEDGCHPLWLCVGHHTASWATAVVSPGAALRARRIRYYWWALTSREERRGEGQEWPSCTRRRPPTRGCSNRPVAVPQTLLSPRPPPRTSDRGATVLPPPAVGAKPRGCAPPGGGGPPQRAASDADRTATVVPADGSPRHYWGGWGDASQAAVSGGTPVRLPPARMGRVFIPAR